MTLTARSAAACENAKSPPSACKCRCGGAMHGKARGAVRELDQADPHFPDDESPKARRAREKAERWEAQKRLLGIGRLLPPEPLPPRLPVGTTAGDCDEATTAPELRDRDGEQVYFAVWASDCGDGVYREGFYRPGDINWNSVALLRAP